MLEDLALYYRTNTSKKQNGGNERKIKSVVLMWIWIPPDYTPGHNLWSGAELKRVRNAFEIKAPKPDSGEVFQVLVGISVHIHILGRYVAVPGPRSQSMTVISSI